MTNRIHIHRLIDVLVEELYCSTKEEARITIDSSVDDVVIHDNGDLMIPMGQVEKLLNEYFDIHDTAEIHNILQKSVTTSTATNSEDNDEGEHVHHVLDEEEGDSEEDLCIRPGECELCERYMKLTRHHLIPKSTWNKIIKRLHFCLMKENHESVEELKQDDNIVWIYKNVILPNLKNDSIIDYSSAKKSRRKTKKSSGTGITSLKLILASYSCDICRQCHSQIHSVLDNLTLALEYNTVDKLLTRTDIYNFCRWASKQKPGKYSTKY